MPTEPTTTLRLAFDPVWSLPVSLLAAIGLIVFVLLTYPRRVRHQPPFWRRTLVALRVLTAIVLAFAILRPELQWTKKNRKAAMLVMLGDLSRSMQTPDGPANATRREVLLKTLTEAEPTIAKLKEEMEVRYFDFGREPQAVEKPDPGAPGEQTAIGFALESILRDAQGQGLSGVLLYSDGAQRGLPPYDVDPRAVARRFGEGQIPIFPIALGTTGTTDTSLDLIVEDLLVDPYAFVKKTVPMRAKLRVLGAAGRKLTVRLLVEDPKTREGLKSGELKIPPASKNAQPVIFIEPTRNTDLIPVELSYIPDLPGEFKIRVEVESLEGEIKTANNARETLLTVRRGGINVAYFDSLPGEQRHLRRLNATDQVQLDWQQVRGGRQRDLNDIDPELFERGRYDVYIIGDVPAKVIGPELLKQLALRVEEGAGLLVIGGHHSFGAGGYADTSLADLLPVAMRSGETVPEEEIDPAVRYTEELQVIPTASGLRHYVMRIESEDKNRAAWLELPPLDGANKLKPKNDFVNILATSEEGFPLLLSNEAGKARVMAFAGNTTWRWSSHGFRAIHQRFWRQMIFWLARKEDDQGQSVWVRIDPRNYLPGVPVRLAFGARSPDGTPLTDVDFDVFVTNPKGERQKLSAQRAGNEFTAQFSQTEHAGDYWVSVTAKSKNGMPIADPTTSRFLVDERDLELDNPAADHALLAELASLTGGHVVTPEQHADFLERLQNEGLVRREETEITRATMWDNWPFLMVFVLLIATEWTLRKLRGLV